MASCMNCRKQLNSGFVLCPACAEEYRPLREQNSPHSVPAPPDEPEIQKAANSEPEALAVDFPLVKNDITCMLYAKWIAAYYEFRDALMEHAKAAFDAKESGRADEIAQRLSRKHRAFTDEAIAETYNLILSEEIEMMVNCFINKFVTDDGDKCSRAQAEVFMTESLVSNFDVFGDKEKTDEGAIQCTTTSPLLF